MTLIGDESSEIIQFNDATLIVHLMQFRKVGELRWECAIEVVPLEAPKRATIKEWKHTSTQSEIAIKVELSETMTIGNKNDAILSIQRLHLSEVAELRGDGALELIFREVPERAIIKE